jgi:hypothetical protein
MKMENDEWWRRNEAMNEKVQFESTYNNNKRKPAEIQSGKSARTIQLTKVQGRSRKLEETKNWGEMRSDRFFTSSHFHWMVQFPLLEAFDDESPRPRHIILCVLVGAAVSGTVTHDAPGSSSIATAAAAAAAASTNDEEVVAVADADVSTREPRLAATAAACRLRRLFDCGDCDAGDDDPMLETDSGRARSRGAGSRRPVRIIDNFRRMMLPSGITLGSGAASETDELDCVGSGVIEARERLNGERTLYATGGCGDDDVGEFARSRSKLPRDELALAGWWFGKRVKNSAGLLPRSANCACMSSFERRSQVSAARPAHLECAMRLQCEHSTAPFFAGSMHTRQFTANTKIMISSQGQGLGSRKRARLLKVVFTKVCSRISKRSASLCGASGGTGDALSVKER